MKYARAERLNTTFFVFRGSKTTSLFRIKEKNSINRDLLLRGHNLSLGCLHTHRIIVGNQRRVVPLTVQHEKIHDKHKHSTKVEDIFGGKTTCTRSLRIIQILRYLRSWRTSQSVTLMKLKGLRLLAGSTE